LTDIKQGDSEVKTGLINQPGKRRRFRSKMMTVGIGASMPVASNKTDDGRAKNRHPPALALLKRKRLKPSLINTFGDIK